MRPPGPDIPADIEVRDLDREVRAELRALPKGAADTVARHLVAAGRFLDTDPQLALEHAQAARQQAARIASVREAVGIAAYHSGEWKLAISELRAWRRFTGSDAHLAVIADSERALGRPEKAIELAASPEAARLDTETRVELMIVAAGARQDQGDLDGALAALDVPELRTHRATEWLPRLRYAYAELLLAVGRTDEARERFVQAADVDPEGLTDADERVLDLDGFLFTDEGTDEDDDTSLDEVQTAPTDELDDAPANQADTLDDDTLEDDTLEDDTLDDPVEDDFDDSRGDDGGADGDGAAHGEGDSFGGADEQRGGGSLLEDADDDSVDETAATADDRDVDADGGGRPGANGSAVDDDGDGLGDDGWDDDEDVVERPTDEELAVGGPAPVPGDEGDDGETGSAGTARGALTQPAAVRPVASESDDENHDGGGRTAG
ncbi:hypothetical protein [Cryptosporangium sp. NPDC048952]|uniref:hypothetical protein n=1 Tax=Cryptosporangium sp. NPDC048952 TaxID=3363961 RepID=UPI003713328E